MNRKEESKNVPIDSYLFAGSFGGRKFCDKSAARFVATEHNSRAAEITRRLLPEIEADKELLERLIKEIGGDLNLLNEAMAWISQKASRVKIKLSKPIGVFEAVEMLCLGVLGKLSLWFALDHSAIKFRGSILNS